MKTTIEKLEHAISTMQETIIVCGSSKSKRVVETSLLESVSSIGDTIVHLKENEKRKFISVRKALTSVSNVMSGMCDGLVDGSLSRQDFRAATNIMKKKFFPAVRQSLIDEVANSESSDESPVRETAVSSAVRSRIKIKLTKLPEMADAFKVVAQSVSVGHEVNGDVKESPLEAMGREARATLPVRIQGEFKMVRVPIVPIFPNPNIAKSETLKRLGLKFVMFEGIVVLQDQILLNVSKKRTDKDSAKSPIVLALELAHSVVDLINERGSVKYEIVSDTPNANPRNTDLLMFWILPRQRMSGLMKMLGASKSPAIVKWGLPSSARTRDRDLQDLKTRSELPLANVLEKQKISELAIKRIEEREAKQAAALAEKQARIQAQRDTQSEKAAVKKAVVKVSVQKPAAKTASQEKLQELVRRNHERPGAPKQKR